MLVHCRRCRYSCQKKGIRAFKTQNTFAVTVAKINKHPNFLIKSCVAMQQTVCVARVVHTKHFQRITFSRHISRSV